MRKNAQGHEGIILSLDAMIRAIVVEEWKSSASTASLAVSQDTPATD
jgi:hypothetical protein